MPIAALAPEELRLSFGGAAALVLIPISYLLGQIAADAGKRLEKNLWTKWQGPPTTRFLRHDNKERGKKPNAILCNEETQKWLYPNGFYTVVRRFSSKEERRRIVASVVDPAVFDEAKYLGLENHLNVFHCDKKPLSEKLARGLAVFLNSTAVDDNFRRFSGHTQVNATDLKLMKYPSSLSGLKLPNRNGSAHRGRCCC